MRLCILLFAVILGCQAASVEEEWRNFMVKFEKNYKSSVETTKRFNIFKEKLAAIEEHNALYEKGGVSWKKGINKFSDLTATEFQETVKCVLNTKTPSNWTIVRKNSVNDEFPESVDWRNEDGVVSDVKDQGQCGACWAFSATGAIEGQYQLEQYTKLTLSAQNLIDCVNKNNGFESEACNGGSVEEAFAYAKLQGVAAEEAYTYEGQAGECLEKKETYKINGQVPVPSTEHYLKQSLSIIGPVSAYMQVTSSLQDYAGGVFSDNDCAEDLNHAVLLVGYGDDDDYWLVKNSWGKDWGDEGYFKISRKNGSCGILNNSLHPILL